MQYDDAVTAFFPARPLDTALPEAVRLAGPARRLRDAAEPIATHPTWSRRVNEAQAELGLDFLSGYVWGRSASLGVPTPAVAASAFAWYEPGMVRSALLAGQAAVSRDRLLEVRLRETSASLAEVLDSHDIAPVADRLLTAARTLPAAGRPLFAGLLDLPEPADPAGRLQRACDLVREARGDAHVAVAVSAGLGPVEMNMFTEVWNGIEQGSYTATRGWDDAHVAAAAVVLEERGWLVDGALTEDGRQVRHELEAATDLAQWRVVQALGDALDDVVSALEVWGELCVSAGVFPADILKRACG
jgi:hypothetical protein